MCPRAVVQSGTTTWWLRRPDHLSRPALERIHRCKPHLRGTVARRSSVPAAEHLSATLGDDHPGTRKAHLALGMESHKPSAGRLAGAGCRVSDGHCICARTQAGRLRACIRRVRRPRRFLPYGDIS